MLTKHRFHTALTAATLLAPIACEREATEEATTMEAVGPGAEGAVGEPGTTMKDRPGQPATQPAPQPGTQPTAQPGTDMDPDMNQRIDAAQQRFERLETQYEQALKRLEAQGDAAQKQVMTELEQARTEAQNKLEAARKATAANARQAVQELDQALETLDKQLAAQEQT